MAKSNPNIPTVNITLQDPVTGYVMGGIVEGVPPAGATYAGIFGLDALLQDKNGSGIYKMSGSVAVPAWVLIGSGISSKTITALGTVQNTTPTALQLIGGILTQTSAVGAGTATLPLGSLISAAIPGVQVGFSFQTVYQNLGGGQAVTITPGASGTTVFGTAAIPSGKNARLTFVNTATDTWSVFVELSA